MVLTDPTATLRSPHESTAPSSTQRKQAPLKNPVLQGSSMSSAVNLFAYRSRDLQMPILCNTPLTLGPLKGPKETLIIKEETCRRNTEEGSPLKGRLGVQEGLGGTRNGVLKQSRNNSSLIC